ncbi:nucleotide sugar dehydrogenase [Carnobacterium maltaromaticum]|uniref:Nucleotide sugar dehydrogenase n=1 Tax=Carnobacterium maltaromaticum TaxID=2751 RepID=A0AAW9JS24_CARML|nr:nucleotide sugar dehydrogenase [Carnobacterium maltaromaticum]MDZ5759575.1 nucleotide sugar dehydrogenase [Carnobacterium maltaromaticum]
MNVVNIGLGYIGLPTAVMLTKAGHRVHGVDTNEMKVNQLKLGKLTIEENGLHEPFLQALKTERLTIHTRPIKADVFMIAVPTPNQEDEYKSCDLSYVEAAIQSILPVLEEGNLVIIESTIAPRSMGDCIIPLLETTGLVSGETLFVAHCPERVLPGNMMVELQENTRIIGGSTKKCTQKISRFYQTFVSGELIQTTAEVAELTKLMENTYRDVNIALANEFIKIGNELKIDALEAIQMANKHPRVNIHSPGPGVGGHCLAVDPYFISAAAPKQSPLIQQARSINSSMPLYVSKIVDEMMEEAPTNKITILGLTYKGNIDDIRESPAMEIVHLLNQKKYDVSLYDPHVSMMIDKYETIEEATDDSSLLLVLTDHDEFINLKTTTTKMARKLILDTKSVVQHFDDNAKYLTLGNTFQTENYEGIKI